MLELREHKVHSLHFLVSYAIFARLHQSSLPHLVFNVICRVEIQFLFPSLLLDNLSKAFSQIRIVDAEEN